MPQSGKKARIGIIGAGGFANTHMEHYAKLPDAEIVAFSRRNPDALKAMQEQWNVPNGFTDYHDLLAMDDLDAVDIITPTDSHHPITLDAIAAGKHVLCDKPLAMTAKEAREMYEAAEKAGVIHSTNFNQRGNTSVGRIKRYMDDGYIGDLYHMNIWWGMTQAMDAKPNLLSWRFRAENGGGTVYELIHVFDMARFLAGEVKRICALLNTAEPHRPFVDVPEGMDVKVEDSSAFLMEFKSGAYGVFHTSFVSRGTDADGKTSARVELSGSKGRITTDGRFGLLGNTGPNGPVAQLEPGDPYPQPYERFVKAILTGEPVETSFYDGMKAAELVDAAFLSAKENRWVEMG